MTDKPCMFAHLSNSDIETAIAEISNLMKGPLPNIERALLHADRKDLRAKAALRAARGEP